MKAFFKKLSKKFFQVEAQVLSGQGGSRGAARGATWGRGGGTSRGAKHGVLDLGSKGQTSWFYNSEI